MSSENKKPIISGVADYFRSMVKSVDECLVDHVEKKEVKENEPRTIGASISLGMDGFVPKVNVTLPISERVTTALDKSDVLLETLTSPRIAEKVDYLTEKLVDITKTIERSNIGVDLQKITSTISNFMQNIVETKVDMLSNFEMGCDTMLYVESIVKIISEPLSFMSVFRLLYTIYKVIKMFVMRLPAIFRSYFVKIDEPVDYEIAKAEAGVGDIQNIGYTALVMMLPKSVLSLLDHYQKYTRVKILEDVNWITDIALVFISLPDYILSGVERMCSSIAILDPYTKSIREAREKMQDITLQVPELSLNSWTARIGKYLSQIHTNQGLLNSVSFLNDMSEELNQVQDLIDKLRIRCIPVPPAFMAMVTEFRNLLRQGSFMNQEARAEPVAIVLYSSPGQGKSFFITTVRETLSKSGANSVYNYTPTPGSKDFHDQYHNQNIWIHEDIGQRGSVDWAQYILHIGNNASRMDGAALDKKSTLFFNSQVILGTTNIDLRLRNLTKEKDCGWTDPEAIYRRWLVVDYVRDSVCDVYKYNLLRHRYYRVGTIDCTNPMDFTKTLYDLYAINVEQLEKLKARISTVAVDKCISTVKPSPLKVTDVLSSHEPIVTQVYGQAEGRKVVTKLETPTPTTANVVTTIPKRHQLVYYKNDYVYLECDQLAQQKWISEGLYINGGQEIVGQGDIIVTDDKASWLEWLSVKYEDTKETAIKRAKTTLADLSQVFALIPREYVMLTGIATTLGIIATAGIAWYYLSRKPKDKVEEQYQPFVHWAKSAKKVTAASLYATSEGLDLGLLFQKVPSDAVKQIQKNVLKATFSYPSITNFGYMIMIDCDHGITTAHTLLESPEQPKEVFVRGFDVDGVEKLSAFMQVVSIDLEEDVAYLKYKNPHVHVFRSLATSLTKVPTDKMAYILATEGVLEIGVPERCEVTSGYYRNSRMTFKSDKILLHNYDKIAKSCAGLCGALAVTGDGYILGWHVAGLSNGIGYVRFWDDKLRAFVKSCESSIAEVKTKENPEVKGALSIDDDAYHHVHLKSGIAPSKMYSEMMSSEILSNEGKPIRAPAVLGGRDPDTSERTYDRSRKKNLIPTQSPVDMNALNFASSYVERLLKNAIKGNELTPLNESEIVAGISEDELVVNRLNKDASAGVTFGGTVADWVDFKGKKIDKRVMDIVLALEKKAALGLKGISDVIFKDCNKDEMRNAEKVHKPRCFSAGPLEYTILLRKWFGRLQGLMMKTRHIHGIMIGINATSGEWGRLWRDLCRFSKHFDGDFEKWDGAMRREFQEKLNEILANLSADKNITLTLLMHLCETTHVGMDETFLTNHSVPSGHGLTALYNSLINKMYAAYAWYILVGQYLKLSVISLCVKMDEQLYVPVYGDDNVFGVADSIADKFNALSFARIMADLGLGYTSASKKPHTKPFCMLRDISFLKRKFVAHREIQDIVGPLELDVLKASCAFTKDVTRDHEIAHQKMGAIQRELYLHSPEIYSAVWFELKRVYAKVFEVEFEELSRNDLYTMYKHGELRSDLFEALAETRTSLPGKRRSKKLVRWN